MNLLKFLKHPIAIWTILVMTAKGLRDTDLFSWTSSILFNIPFFEWWRSNPSVFDVFHIADGFIITSSFIMIFYYYAKSEMQFKESGLYEDWKFELVDFCAIVAFTILWFFLSYTLLFNFIYHIILH